MSDSLLEGTDVLTCPFSIPNPDVPVGQILTRWSDGHVAHPAIIITPRTEEDILSAISFAKQNRLRIIPAGGGHGSCVEIDSRTLYLDMRNFKSIAVDKEARAVRFGGGVLTGELMKAVGAEGYYTSLANSNSVGVVGSLLGGGHTTQVGFLGWMVDNVLSFRLITAAGIIVEVGSSSTGDDLALFHALCGGGHGLGVVTAATMRIHLISDLSLPDNDKVWTRTMIFPATAIDAVSEAFASMQPPAQHLNLLLIFTCSPPEAGLQPIIIAMATYYGPLADAETATTSLHSPALVAQAFQANTSLIPVPNVNDNHRLFNDRGGFKIMCAARLRTFPQDSLKASFARWLVANKDFPDSSTILFHSFNASGFQEIGNQPGNSAKFVEARDRGIHTVITSCCHDVNASDSLSSFVDDMVSICRQGDAGRHIPRTFPNVRRQGMDLEELFTKEKLAELDRQKKKWDGNGLFWSPYQR